MSIMQKIMNHVPLLDCVLCWSESLSWLWLKVKGLTFMLP